MTERADDVAPNPSDPSEVEVGVGLVVVDLGGSTAVDGPARLVGVEVGVEIVGGM
jgi:putative transposon-encoded protein